MALIAALRPGTSPPPVRTPSVLIGRCSCPGIAVPPFPFLFKPLNRKLCRCLMLFLFRCCECWPNNKQRQRSGAENALGHNTEQPTCNPTSSMSCQSHDVAASLYFWLV